MDQLLSRHPHPLPYRRRHQHRHHAPLTPIPQPLPPQLLHRRPPVPHRRHAGIERHPLRHRDPPPPLPAHIPHLVRRLLPMVILPPHDHAAPHGGQQHHRPRCVIPPVHSRPPPDLSFRPAPRPPPPPCLSPGNPGDPNPAPPPKYPRGPSLPYRGTVLGELRHQLLD